MAAINTEWMVGLNPIACKMFYIAYRLKDGKIEKRGGCYESRIDAERLAATLNAEEKNK